MANSTTNFFCPRFGQTTTKKTAIYIANLQTGKIIYQHRADLAMNPASSMKLFTSYVALQKLGPKHHDIPNGVMMNQQQIVYTR